MKTSSRKERGIDVNSKTGKDFHPTPPSLPAVRKINIKGIVNLSIDEAHKSFSIFSVFFSAQLVMCLTTSTSYRRHEKREDDIDDDENIIINESRSFFFLYFLFCLMLLVTAATFSVFCCLSLLY